MAVPRDVRHYTQTLSAPTLVGVAWFYRIVELESDRWAYRFGQRQFDVHTALPHAIEHMRLLAAEHQPAHLFVHRLDGSVDALVAI